MDEDLALFDDIEYMIKIGFKFHKIMRFYCIRNRIKNIEKLEFPKILIIDFIYQALKIFLILTINI